MICVLFAVNGKTVIELCLTDAMSIHSEISVSTFTQVVI